MIFSASDFLQPDPEPIETPTATANGLPATNEDANADTDTDTPAQTFDSEPEAAQPARQQAPATSPATSPASSPAPAQAVPAQRPQAVQIQFDAEEKPLWEDATKAQRRPFEIGARFYVKAVSLVLNVGGNIAAGTAPGDAGAKDYGLSEKEAAEYSDISAQFFYESNLKLSAGLMFAVATLVIVGVKIPAILSDYKANQQRKKEAAKKPTHTVPTAPAPAPAAQSFPSQVNKQNTQPAPASPPPPSAATPPNDQPGERAPGHRTETNMFASKKTETKRAKTARSTEKARGRFQTDNEGLYIYSTTGDYLQRADRSEKAPKLVLDMLEAGAKGSEIRKALKNFEHEKTEA